VAENPSPATACLLGELRHDVGAFDVATLPPELQSELSTLAERVDTIAHLIVSRRGQDWSDAVGRLPQVFAEDSRHRRELDDGIHQVNAARVTVGDILGELTSPSSDDVSNYIADAAHAEDTWRAYLPDAPPPTALAVAESFWKRNPTARASFTTDMSDALAQSTDAQLELANQPWSQPPQLTDLERYDGGPTGCATVLVFLGATVAVSRFVRGQAHSPVAALVWTALFVVGFLATRRARARNADRQRKARVVADWVWPWIHCSATIASIERVRTEAEALRERSLAAERFWASSDVRMLSEATETDPKLAELLERLAHSSTTA
jgi:hypothetical protein